LLLPARGCCSIREAMLVGRLVQCPGSAGCTVREQLLLSLLTFHSSVLPSSPPITAIWIHFQSAVITYSHTLLVPCQTRRCKPIQLTQDRSRRWVFCFCKIGCKVAVARLHSADGNHTHISEAPKTKKKPKQCFWLGDRGALIGRGADVTLAHAPLFPVPELIEPQSGGCDNLVAALSKKTAVGVRRGGTSVWAGLDWDVREEGPQPAYGGCLRNTLRSGGFRGAWSASRSDLIVDLTSFARVRLRPSGLDVPVSSTPLSARAHTLRSTLLASSLRPNAVLRRRPRTEAAAAPSSAGHLRPAQSSRTGRPRRGRLQGKKMPTIAPPSSDNRHAISSSKTR